MAMVAANERRAVDDLFMLLPGEADSVREEIYELFTRVESEVADRALLHGFKEERERVLTLVSQVIWRKQSAVTVLVREDLVRAWGADRKYAKRILRLLSDECLRVPRRAVLGAPADLVEALGTQLIDDP